MKTAEEFRTLRLELSKDCRAAYERYDSGKGPLELVVAIGRACDSLVLAAEILEAK